MISEIIDRLQKAEPPFIERVEITSDYPDNPELVLSNNIWSISIECPWRLIDIDKNIMLDGKDVVKILKKKKIIKVEAQSSLHEIDLAMTFNNKVRLEIFSDQSLEPWIMRFSDLIFVPNPSSSNLF